jgi:hypothetical protein
MAENSEWIFSCLFGALDKLQGVSWNRLRKRKSVRITKDLSEKIHGRARLNLGGGRG